MRRCRQTTRPGLIQDAEPLAPVVVVRDDEPGSSSGWTVGLAAAALGLGALGLAAAIVSSDNRAATSAMARPVSPAAEGILAQRLGRTESFGLAADLLWGGAAAAAVGAGVAWGLSPSGHDRSPGPSVGPGPGTVGLSLGSAF